MPKTIEIRTTQNVAIDYELASLRERLLASLLDGVIIAIGYFVFFQLLLVVASTDLLEGGGWMPVFVFIPFLLYFLYNILFEIWSGGQTLGKRAMNIRVVRLDGKDPEWSDVLLRAVLQLVDSLFSFGVIGSLLIKTTPKCQRLGDMAANTTVIKLYNTYYHFQLADIQKISSLEEYTLTYPQVRNLSERDMIFIKRVLDRFRTYPNEAHDEVVEDLVTHLMPLLGIRERPLDRVGFLRTLLRDYIVLTR